MHNQLITRRLEPTEKVNDYNKEIGWIPGGVAKGRLERLGGVVVIVSG